MKSVVCGLFLIGCASAPMSETQAVRDDAHVLGLLPVRNIVGDVGIKNVYEIKKTYELVLCKVSSEYTEEYLQENCKPALVTKGNGRVLFSQTPEYVELSKTELWLLGGFSFSIPALAFWGSHSEFKNAKKLKGAEEAVQMSRSHYIKSGRITAVFGITALVAATIALLYGADYLWGGADKRELKRLRNDIFKTDVDFSKATMSKKDITKLLAVLAKKLDLQVSREAQIPISNTQ